MPETDTKPLADNFPTFLEKFHSEIVAVIDLRGQITAVVEPNRIREMALFLKQDPGTAFETLMDLFAMDYSKDSIEHRERFAVVYSFYSLSKGHRLFLKAYLPEERPEIDSIHDVYATVNWFEREAWDLFGIVFRGHPNLRRILCHEEFHGHPLRKEYPSNGFQQLKNASDMSGA